jgi:histidinol-phosphate phosphatase family protein
MEGRRPVVFIDRDGTIIQQVDVLTKPSEVKLLPGAAEAIADLNRRGYLVIAVTNQPIIEKGLLSMEGLEAIHRALRDNLASFGAELDGIYTCPHKYRAEGQCTCRKPGIGLIKQAEAQFSIDREKSWFIGDRLRDVQTGKNAGMKTILVPTGGESKDDEFFPDAKPDYTAKNLLSAVALVR